MMLTRMLNGAFVLSADAYILTFPIDRPFVYVDDRNGKRLFDLFVLSSVHPLQGRDDSVKVYTWETEETPDEVVFWVNAGSPVWEHKTYRFHCYADRFSYEIEVEGQGDLVEVNYFGGYFSANLRWGSGFFHSGQSLVRGFNPAPNSEEINYFVPGEGSIIKLIGVPLPGKSSWFFTPPPFCFAFEGKSEWVSMGVEARVGENNYTAYEYHGQRDCFHLSLSFDGHTRVDGKRRLPSIGFDFGQDEYAVIASHVHRLHDQGGQPVSNKPVRPNWWFEPIYSGWGEQCYAAKVEKGHGPDYARQDFYEGSLRALEDHDVDPGIVVIDDKWQASYGENNVDRDKWPDLKGFIDSQHQKGRKVLLWLKAWDPEGVPAEECITNAAELPLAVDPTHPAFQERLRASVRRMLSSEGYGADGFKIDFTARIPSGPGIRTYGDIWGLELMKAYLGIIYTEAKKTKPEALVMTHTPHPYLADVTDMIRLNDINVGTDINQAMSIRALIAAIACPEAVIDTDNWPITNKSVWRKYLRLQPSLGVPSLYYASHIDSTGEPLQEEDYKLIRQVWSQYRAGLASEEEGEWKAHRLKRSIRSRMSLAYWIGNRGKQIMPAYPWRISVREKRVKAKL